MSNFTDCPYLELANGVSQPATSVSHGSTVTITCDSGYALRGNGTIICENGVLLDVPSCVEIGTAGIHQTTCKMSWPEVIKRVSCSVKCRIS